MALTTRVLIDGEIHFVDTVEYQGALWLVPGWRELPGNFRQPARIIRFDNLPHRMVGYGRYEIDVEMPASMFSPEFQSGQENGEFEIVDRPRFALPMKETIQ